MKKLISLKLLMTLTLITGSYQMYSYNSTHAASDLKKAGKVVVKSARNTKKGLFGNNNLSEAEQQKMRRDIIEKIIRDNKKMQKDTEKLIAELNMQGEVRDMNGQTLSDEVVIQAGPIAVQAKNYVTTNGNGPGSYKPNFTPAPMVNNTVGSSSMVVF